MKTIFYLIAVLLIFGCQENQTKPAGTITAKGNKYKKLLSKFKEISFDTLKVYSPEELTGEYQGIELDSADAILFPEEIAQLYFMEPPGIFGVYKIALDGHRIGLIARTPSTYVPSSIKFFILDTTKEAMTSYAELAESWGDAGDYMTKDAWLYQEKRKGLRAFLWVQEGHYNSVENEADTTKQEYNYYYLLNMSGTGIDTISQDSEALKTKFGHLMNSKP